MSWRAGSEMIRFALNVSEGAKDGLRHVRRSSQFTTLDTEAVVSNLWRHSSSRREIRNSRSAITRKYLASFPKHALQDPFQPTVTYCKELLNCRDHAGSR